MILQRFVILAMLLFGTMSCEAQSDANRDARRILEVDGGLVKNFGTVTHKDRLDHTFVLRNPSSDTVVIEEIKASCGCTPVMLSGKTVAPGGTASVGVKFAPPRTSNGRVSHGVSVFVEGVPGTALVLRVEADVRSSFESEPELVDAGTLPVRREAIVTFLLRNVSDETQYIMTGQSALMIEYRGMDQNGPPEVRPISGVTISPMEFSIEPDSAREITVQFTPQLIGKLMGSVVFYAQDETRQVEFTGFLSASLQSPPLRGEAEKQ